MALSRPAQLNLHAAAAQGDTQTIAQLAESGSFNVNVLDEHGKRAIDCAAEKGQKEALMYLIDTLHASLDETAIEEEHKQHRKIPFSQRIKMKAPRHGILQYAWQNSKENAFEIIAYLMEKNVTPNVCVCRDSESFFTNVMLSMDSSFKSLIENKLSQDVRTKILRWMQIEISNYVLD